MSSESRLGMVFLMVFGLFPDRGLAQPRSGGADAPDPYFERALTEITRRPVGDQTLVVLNLPESFLRRAADRIVRSSYQERYHVVVADAGTGEKSSPTTRLASGRQPVGMDSADIVIRRHEFSRAIQKYRLSLVEQRPPLRGFRAPILERADDPWPIRLGQTATKEMRAAADVVARRLAFDGLPATLASALQIMGPTEFIASGAEQIRALRSIGLPVDLLACFKPPGGGSNRSNGLVDFIAGRLVRGETADSLRPVLQSLPFEYRAANSGFRVATESGEQAIGTVRLQLTRGTYWGGAGAGGCLDVARQLVECLPEASFVASIEEKHLESFTSLAASWPLRRPGCLTVVPEPLVVSQWAQDNGKAGVLVSESQDRPVIATLVPRFASRGEDGSSFIPGESFLMDGVAATGMTVIQSSLLFQGGNLLAVLDPATGQRVLLIGEAEVYRNTALGLSYEQVLEAFRVEFAVDRCLVLAGVSFHVDFDVCIRNCNGRLTAFVNDSLTAAQIVLRAGIGVLERHGVLEHGAAAAARDHVSANRPAAFLGVVGPAVGRQTNARRQFPESFANLFAREPEDSGVGNMRCFLLAMDTFVHGAITPTDGRARSYLLTFGRRDRDRAALSKLLAAQGWRVAGVPSLADGNRSINYLNGIHSRGRYLMPAYGGLFKGLDAAAAAVFRRETGGSVEVVPIVCGESLRRVGAIHCSAVVYPQL